MAAIWRYRTAGLWLRIHRLLSQWAPTPPGGFRILNFHHIPRAHEEGLRRLVTYLLDRYGILTPGEAEVRPGPTPWACSGRKSSWTPPLIVRNLS
jgi:hypothetical protein